MSDRDSEVEASEANEGPVPVRPQQREASEDRGRSQGPVPPQQRGRSPGPGAPSTRARSRSGDRTPGAATNAGLKKGKRPDNNEATSRSKGPGAPSTRARSRSADRTPGAATNAGLMKGKRPDNNDDMSRQHSSQHSKPPPQHYKKKKHMMPKQVRKVVPKGVRKGTKKGYKKVKKYGAKPVQKFQNTTLGQRVAPQDKCGTGKICSYCFAIILLIASAIGLVIATGNAGALESLVPNIDIANLQQKQEINGIWSVPGKTGLQIEIINALDDSWQDVFFVALEDWNYGTDSLDLSTTRVEHDPECTPVDGKIKVCNGDYGENPWRGLAVCVLKAEDSNYKNCNAKMNDYYLKSGGFDIQEYTMCHEIGHGFGLPHTDEDFDNADLGNCMDYTNNFSVNKKPDDTNYDKLREFYGSKPGTRRKQRQLRKRKVGNTKKKNTPTMTTTTTTGTLGAHFKSEEQEAGNSTTTTTTHEEEYDELRNPKSTAQPPVIGEPTPPHIWQKRKSALEQFDSLFMGIGTESHLLEEYGWKLMERTLFEEEHMLDLGDGYLLEVQVSAP